MSNNNGTKQHTTLSQEERRAAQVALSEQLKARAELATFLVEKVRENNAGVKDVALLVIQAYVNTYRRLGLTPSKRVDAAVQAISNTPRATGVPHDWRHGSGMMMGRRALELAKQIEDECTVHDKKRDKWVTMTRYLAICELDDQVATRNRNHARRQSDKAASTATSQRSGAKLKLIHDSGRQKNEPHRRSANNGARRDTMRRKAS